MVPLVVVGALTITVAVTTQFFTVALISDAGGDAVAYLDAADAWFVPLFIGWGCHFRARLAGAGDVGLPQRDQ